MKCASCGYYNLPNTTVCGRCRRSLAPATAPAETSFADLYPPRARNRPRLWRLLTWWERNASRVTLPHIEPGVLTTSREETARSLIAMAGIVPGLGAAVYRRRKDAVAQSTGSLALAGLFAVTIHYDISNLFGFLLLTLLAYCQFYTLRLIYPPPADEDRRFLRAVRHALLSIVAVALTSIALMRLSGELYLVQSSALEPVFHEGDTIVVRDSAKIHRGEIVAAQLDSTGLGDGEHDVIIQGLTVDRVLGLPGDTVTVDGGAVWVNGAHSSMANARIQGTEDATVKVPPGTVCVWRPGVSVNYDDGPATPGMLRGLSTVECIGDTSIIGRVVAVVSPARDRRIVK